MSSQFYSLNWGYCITDVTCLPRKKVHHSSWIEKTTSKVYFPLSSPQGGMTRGQWKKWTGNFRLHCCVFVRNLFNTRVFTGLDIPEIISEVRLSWVVFALNSSYPSTVIMWLTSSWKQTLGYSCAPLCQGCMSNYFISKAAACHFDWQSNSFLTLTVTKLHKTQGLWKVKK